MGFLVSVKLKLNTKALVARQSTASNTIDRTIMAGASRTRPNFSRNSPKNAYFCTFIKDASVSTLTTTAAQA